MSQSRRAQAALLSITAVWGLTFVMVQDAISAMPVMAFLAWRFIPAALLLGLVFRHRPRSLSSRGLAQGLFLGVFLTIGYVTQTFGLEATTASKAGFITGLFVVFTPLVARLVGGPPVPAIAWAAAAVSTVGLYLLSGAGGSFTLRGDGLELLCAVAFAAHIVATDRAVDEGHDVVGLVVVQLAVVGVACLAVAVATGGFAVPHGASVWSALVVTAVVASALAFVVQSWAQKHADPARTALILAGEPAFAGLFGWLLAGDRMGVAGWVGAALIILAILAADAMPRVGPRRAMPEG